MATGKVKWYNRKKGFGFITPDIGARDIFVHISSVHEAGLSTLGAGDRLEFELVQFADGRLAAHGLRAYVDGMHG